MGLTQQIRQPLQFELQKLSACDDAMKWARGKKLDAETWAAAPSVWKKWLADRLGCECNLGACIKASKEARKDGDGDGYGDGYGYGYGDGYGYGYGYGDGYGDGYGYGYGDGDGDGYGYGSEDITFF